MIGVVSIHGCIGLKGDLASTNLLCCCGKLGDMMAYHLSGLTLEMESSFCFTDHFQQFFYTI